MTPIERNLEQRILDRRLPRAVKSQPSARSNEWLFTFLTRLSFLAVTLGVLAGVWLVMDAHLTEQFLGTPKGSQRLIDRDQGRRALTPETIEKRVLEWRLQTQSEQLYVPVGSNARQRPFIINPGEPARYVAGRLEEEGFITDASLFNLYMRVTGIERRINSGNFMLAETMTMPEIAEALQHAMEAEAVVTIPEGFRVEEIAERLVHLNVLTSSDQFLEAVRNPRSLSSFDEYDFLQNLPDGASLEGFLFPDTYRIPVFASSLERVLAPFLDNFERRIGTEGLVGSNIQGRELITLASIVEREAVQADERPLIASVYLNRLSNRCADTGGRYLQADPTVQYAKGVAGNWWWKPTDIKEYAEVDSPYNTYLHEGLPPGPIANPGLSAIEAARSPAATAYCFFVGTNQDGRHVFAVTLAEHEANMRAYGYQ